MEGIYLLLGTNLGDKEKNLTNAINGLKINDIQMINRSSIYETAAWGKTNQATFYNCVVQVKTDLKPLELLKLILKLEIKLGRVRKEKWGERLIDIDILYYNNYSHSSEELTIPHPGIQKRRFTLIPLVEIAAEFIHPILKINQSELLKLCSDDLPVQKIKSEN